MHVVLLGPFPPPNGGVQTHLVSLRAFLREAGLRVSVVNITRHRKTEEDEVYYPRSAVGLIGRLTRLRPDVLHVHLGGELRVRNLALCLTCAEWPRSAALLTFHSGGYPASPAGRMASPRSLTGFVLRRLDHLVAVNREIERLFHRFGATPDRVSVIEPYADVAPSSPTVQIPENLGAFAGAHHPLLVTVGLLEPEYCLPLQIAALTRIRDGAPRAGLMIIGSGSLEADVRARIEASPARDHILLAGDVPHAATLGLIGRANLLLRTTAFDGDSISVREALQLGTPVLASDNGMRPDGVHLLDELTPAGLARRALEVAGAPRLPVRAEQASNHTRVLSLYRRLLALQRSATR